MDYTHGSHWECIVKDIDSFFETNLDDVIRNSFIASNYSENGYNLENDEVIENNIHILQYLETTDTPILLTTIYVNKALWTAYPSLNYGFTQDIIIEQIYDIGNLVEGLIRCHLAEYPDFTFTFFDAKYYANKSKYTIGNRYTFIFAGYAYGVSQSNMKNQHIEIDNKQISLDGMAMFIANETGYLDDYKINSKVLKVEDFTLLNNPMKAIVIKALNTTEINFRFPIFVAKHNINNNYNVVVGEDISGSIWMTGVLDED